MRPTALQIALHPIPEPSPTFSGEEDLQELIGNLIDNTCQWALTRVTVGCALFPAGTVRLQVTIDDGSSIAPEENEAVIVRGVHLDESAPGTGSASPSLSRTRLPLR